MAPSFPWRHHQPVYFLDQPEKRFIMGVEAALEFRQREGDALYVYSQAQHQFQYYADLRNLSVGNVHFGAHCGIIPSCYEADLESLHRPSWVWILLSHILINGQTDEEQIILAQLDAMGARLDEKRSPGARAYLYDLSAGAKTIPKLALPQP